MLDDDTAELVLTADGSLLNIAFVEDLVETAPNLKGWKFTALKPAMENEDFTINMGDLFW
jgi:predicted fused transcriptional regulator/phosphomethylpyrimidine kinase